MSHGTARLRPPARLSPPPLSSFTTRYPRQCYLAQSRARQNGRFGSVVKVKDREDGRCSTPRRVLDPNRFSDHTAFSYPEEDARVSAVPTFAEASVAVVVTVVTVNDVFVPPRRIEEESAVTKAT